MFRSRSVLCTAVLCLAFTPVLAQSTLEVTVIDASSESPVAGVALTLTHQAIGLESSATTNAQGKARFLSLPTGGPYVLVAAGGTVYGDATVEDVRIRSNQMSSLTLALQPRPALTETVSVTGAPEAARINTINAETSATLELEELTLTPVEGRDLTRALYRLPNVTQATGFYPEAPNVSINGANSLYATYLIDGLDNTENFLGGQKFAIPVGFVQDVSVLTSSYSAEFGRTGNGVFNVTSRSGSNVIGGEAFFLMRPGNPPDAPSPFAGRDLSGNAVKDGFERYQMGFGLGGPIVKDRTFYFVSAEATRDNKDNLLTSPELGVNDTVEGNNRFGYYSARVDHSWSSSLSSSFRVNVGEVGIERQGGGLEGGVSFPSAANTQDRNSVLAAVKTTWTGSRLISETGVQFSRFHWDYGDPENGPGPNVTVLDTPADPNMSPTQIAALGHPGFIFDSVENTLQLKQKFMLPRDNHTLSFGVEVISADFDLFGGDNVDGSYRVQLTQAQIDDLVNQGIGADLDVDDLPANTTVLDYDVELRPDSFGARQNIYSGWFEDLWSVHSSLNLTLGLRYDLDTLSKGGNDAYDMDNIAPRIGANWQLDDRSVVRGGVGLFYDKVLYAIHSDALQQNLDTLGYRTQIQALIDRGYLPRDTNLHRVLFQGNSRASFCGNDGELSGCQGTGVDYLQGPTGASLAGQEENVFSGEARILNPDGYDNPVTAQYTLGYQRQLTDTILFQADLIHTRARHLPRLRNLNAPAPWFVNSDTDPDDAVRSTAEADLTRPLADLGAVPGGALNIVMSEMEGEAHYSAATFMALGERGSTPFSWRFSYTLSRLENDTDDINFRAEDSNRFQDEWGPSINDRTHVINALLFYHALPSLRFSLGTLLQSGQPINRIPDGYGTTDLNGDGQSFSDAYLGNSDRMPGEARNNDRLPWSEVFDVGVRWLVPRAGARAMELSADVFNVFNAENLSGYSNNATQSNQIQAGPAGSSIVRRNAGPGRQFQFGVRYVF